MRSPLSLINFLITLAMVAILAVSVGCNEKYTRADQQAFATDVKLTSAIAAASGYAALANCQLTGNQQPCAKTNVLKKLAPATKKLSDAIDAYNAQVYGSPGGAAPPGQSMAYWTSQVNAALAVLNTLIADEGIEAVLAMKGAK